MYACQRDSYLKEFETKVVSVVQKNGHLEVELEDTILFPEGGGQNHDTGTIGDHRVFKVIRDGSRAIHHLKPNETATPLEPQQSVTLVVDWERRFDNMQQHTGQHVLSALLQEQLGLQTNSWWMAENTQEEVGQSYIELSLMDGYKPPSEEDIRGLERNANQLIRDHLPVSVTAHKVGDPALEEAYSRGLPQDLPSDALIRIVDIVGDKNMCCGTHVENLSHLQMIKILQFSKSKKKDGDFLLYFLVGERVASFLSLCFNRENKLTTLLKNRPLDHYSLVDKALTSSKNAKKINSNLLKELAVLEAEKLKHCDPLPKFVCNYRKEGTTEYTGTFIKELTSDKNINIFIFLIVGSGESGSPFQMTLSGDPQDVRTLGPKILDLLDGKGGGSGARFNAKVNSLKEYKNAVQIVESYFK